MKLMHQKIAAKITAPILPKVGLLFWAAVATAPVQLPTQAQAQNAAPSIVVGNIRVQLLSDSVVRVELKGPEDSRIAKLFTS